MRLPSHRRLVPGAVAAALVTGLFAACSHPAPYGVPVPATDMSRTHPNPDPRVGLKSGLWNAGEAAWNLRVLSHTHSPDSTFLHSTNSDLAFTGQYVIQGNYNGYQVWDISDPAHPTLKTKEQCPASQSDVSVYKNLLFVSGEGFGGRLDCGAEGVKDTVSKERLRGLRIFDISDITNPKYIANVQTCRGSHTHTVLADPKDPDNVYVYISGSAPVRSPSELAGCSGAQPGEDSTTALFRIEVIKVPLAHPEQAAIVSSPRIFHDLVAPPTHGLSEADKESLDKARAQGKYVVTVFGNPFVLPDRMITPLLDSIAKTHGGTTPSGADSAALRSGIQAMVDRMVGRRQQKEGSGPPPGPTQCHDITVYAQIGYAGGACEGYGLLLDIRDPAHPVRLAAVDDSNFSYWHSATFSNDGTKLLFSDEWGGGGGPKCRAKDPREWGADAIFRITNNQLVFQSYYKLPAVQTDNENCVAHNGSLIPIPGRDVMVQSWYQGGISVFDWTDPMHPQEIAFFDYGPIDSTKLVGGGSWSAYWYNGVIVSSEIARGLDIFALQPSGFISQNEIDAAKSVHFSEWNTQGQRTFVWPASFALSRAYVDQLERSGGLTAAQIAAARQSLKAAEGAAGATRQGMLTLLGTQLSNDVAGSSDGAKVQLLAQSVKDLAAATH